METFREASLRFDQRVQSLAGALAIVLQRKLDEREWTPMDLAWRSGININSIYKILTGERNNPRFENFLKLAWAFDEDAGRLLLELEKEVSARRQVAGVDHSTLARDNAKPSLSSGRFAFAY